MNFKDMVAADVRNVFLNESEFAEIRTIVYDGRAFENVPIVLTHIKQKELPVVNGNRMDGIYNVSEVMHISEESLKGIIPQKNQTIGVEDGTAMGHIFIKKYDIASVSCAEGMITLELEARDE